MMRWNNRKNNLDERQDQKLLHIEKNCFWLLDFLLAAVIIIELLMGQKKSEMAGELFCLLTANIVMVISCIRNGIWDRHMKMDAKTNLRVSAVAAAAVMVINVLFLLTGTYEYHSPGQVAAILIFPGVITYFATLALVAACGALTMRRARHLEEQEEEADD